METKAKKKLFIILLLFVVVSAIIGTGLIINRASDINKAREQQNAINKATVETVAPSDFLSTKDYDGTEASFEPSYIVDFENLKSKNNDVVAWIKIEDTEIEYPVVQSNDNDYYLNRDIDRNENQAGWIFADWANNMETLDMNTVLYGHNMRDGSMFAGVNHLLSNINSENCQNHKVTFVTQNHYYEGYIFSIYEVDPDEDYRTANPDDITAFTRKIHEASWSSLELPEFDRILTLSTCANVGDNRTACHIALKEMS